MGLYGVRYSLYIIYSCTYRRTQTHNPGAYCARVINKTKKCRDDACKSKGTRWDDACKSKGTRWDDACKSKSPKYPYRLHQRFAAMTCNRQHELRRELSPRSDFNVTNLLLKKCLMDSWISETTIAAVRLSLQRCLP